MTTQESSPDIQPGNPNPPTNTVQLCAGDYGYGKFWVNAELHSGGQLVFAGHDLNPHNLYHAEYEYTVTVAAQDVPKLLAALGGDAGDDLLALIQAHRLDILERGEDTWLRQHSINYELWNRVGEPLPPLNNCGNH